MKKKWTTKMLVEAGIMIALSFILSKIKIYKMPLGGSVTAGSMIPIILFSLRWGAGPGFICGALYGLLKMALGGSIISPIQAVLDYPLPFALLGLSGIFSDSLTRSKEGKFGKIIMGSFIAICGRFLCHFIAGVTFYKSSAAGVSPVWHSITYNATYLIPEFLITALIIGLIWKPLERADLLQRNDY